MSIGIIIFRTNNSKMQSSQKNENNIFCSTKNSNHNFNIKEDIPKQSLLCMPTGHLMIVIVC